MSQTIIITIPMIASPVGQIILGLIAIIAAVRAVARFLDTLPVA